MTERIASPATGADPALRRRRRRHAAERRFRACGVISIVLAVAALCWLLGSIVAKGASAFWQTHIAVEVDFAEAAIDPGGRRDANALREANYTALVRTALYERFPEARTRSDRRALAKLVSSGAGHELRRMVLADASLIGARQRLWLVASDDVDQLVKGAIRRDLPESERRIDDRQLAWLDALTASGAVDLRFNARFFVAGDSREPELAGIWGAVVGSLFTMLITIALSFPLGVATAVYLEEFAPKNRWTDLIEININNLAAVPSIVFGLLGLAVFLNFFELPRSAPVVGGMVLALMTLPTIIIAGRGTLKAVPPSIREGALAVGASRVQVVTHHVLPLAMPGILTGTIIGLARALGETAPLLMIGMVAFIVDVPADVTEPATALPVQIFIWADASERAFVERTAAATMVLLAFLIAMNLLAVLMRKRFERRW